MLILLPVLLLAPGIGLAALLNKRLAVPLDPLERGLVVLAGGLVSSWLALVLGEFGRFSLPTLTLLILAIAVLLFYIARRSQSVAQTQAAPLTAYSYLALGLLTAACLLSIPANQYFIGGRDHGLYIHTGIHLAKQGSILFDDPAMAGLPADLRDVVIKPDVTIWKAGLPGPWSEGQRLSGLTIRDAEAGIVAPHAFHFYSALIAIFAATGGPPLAIYATLYAGLTGLLALYLVVRRVVSERVALLLLLLLVANVAMQWYLRTPSAEIMVFFAFWTGLWALLRADFDTAGAPANQHGALLLNIVAGCCFGAVHLAKLDMLLVPFGLAAYWGLRWITGDLRGAQWAGIAAYLLVSAHAVLHAFYISTIYFLDHLVRVILPDFLAEPLAAAADGRIYPNEILAELLGQQGVSLLLIVLASLVGLVVLRMLRPVLARVASVVAPRQQWLRLMVVLPMALWIALQLGQLLQGGAASTNAFFLNRLYLTRIGLLVGMVGFVWLALTARTPARMLLVWLLFANSAYLFVLGAQTAPDQFWSARRFVPVVFPALLLAGLWAVEHVGTRLLARGALTTRWLWLPLAGLVAVLLAGFAPHVRPQIGLTEFVDVYPQLEAVSAEFNQSDVLLIEASGPAFYFTLPLWQTFDRTVFQIETDSVNDARLAEAVTHWQREGRGVYWLKVPELPLPNWVQNSAELTGTQRLVTSIMEQPRDRIPHNTINYDLTLEIHRFR